MISIMKMFNVPSTQLRLFIVSSCLSIGFTGVSAAQIHENIGVDANVLADSIRKIGAKKVVVVPVVFTNDIREAQWRESKGDSSGNDKQVNTLRLSVDNKTLLLAEEMERSLAGMSNGDFRLTPSVDIFDELRKNGVGAEDLNPRGKRLSELVNPNGDIQLMVVGTLRRFFDVPENKKPNKSSRSVSDLRGSGAPFHHYDGSLGPEKQSLEWNLIDLSDRTIRDTPEVDSINVSLADAVYRGLSVELFRHEGNALRYLLPYNEKDRKDLPLRPSDPEVLFDRSFAVRQMVHPIMNPKCPFKVQFEVDGKERPLQIVVSKNQEFLAGIGSKTVERIAPLALVNFEPGESPAIKLTNSSNVRVHVAVYIDGVNIRGKVRELPDENCKTWALDAGKTGFFSNWVTGEENSKGIEEPFRISEWKDSLAGKLGIDSENETARSITIVVFTEDLPKHNNIRFFERYWLQKATLASDRKRVLVEEGMMPLGFAASGGPDVFGMGAKKPKPGTLQWVNAGRPGTILASMTVNYAPKSDLLRIAKSKAKELPLDFTFGSEPDLSLVELGSQGK